MSQSNVSRLSKVFFPQADLESPLRGQNALLTGASYGIGAQIAAHLAAQGINIAVSARSPRSLAALAKELIDRYGVTIAVIPADLTRASDRARLYPEAQQKLGRVDILVNNAGIYLGGRHDHRSDEDDLTTALINIVAPQQLTRAALREMRPRRSGHIIHIGSIAGMAALPYSATYAASKSANVGFNQSIQGELQEAGVFSTAVNPGFTKNDGLWERLEHAGHDAFGETTTTDVAEKVVHALLNPGLVSIVSNPNQEQVRGVAALWDTDPVAANAAYNQLQVPAFMADVAKKAETLGPLEPDVDAPPTRLAVAAAHISAS